MYIEYPMIGKHPASLLIFEAIKEASRTDDPLTITGETGTGKELIANAIQKQSRRREKAYVRINCTELQRERLALQLFKERTKGKAAKPGLISEAEGGTLLLDEIESLPLAMQAKLLNFIKQNAAKSLTGGGTVSHDVRIIAVSNADLQRRVEHGVFSAELFERLNINRLHAPALRERKTDIPMLIGYYLGIMAKHYEAPCPRLAKETLTMLMEYQWPGNIRELRNVCENLVVRRLACTVHPEHLPINPDDTGLLLSIDHTLLLDERLSRSKLDVMMLG
ncbi:MAG: sigma-54-dependent transcriptional regulator [Gammaproteobacteria bacterium]